jgi:hypothetical protein
MLKSVLPLSLVALCVPAQAFPPCPQEPIDVVPIDNPNYPPRPNTPPWFLSAYTMVGDPSVVLAIRPPPCSGSECASTCRPSDALPVPSTNTGATYLGAKMLRSPITGFGLIGLPDIRENDPGETLTYTLSFTVDATPLAQNGDWFDVAELVLEWTNPLSTVDHHEIASVYRVRKLRTANGIHELQVIESRRTSPDEPAMPILAYDQVVATITFADNDRNAPIKLRWSQRTRVPPGGDIEGPYVPASIGRTSAVSSRTAKAGASTSGAGSTSQAVPPTVDTTIEVVGSNGQTLYQQTLWDQWASDLSMGLLDYNTQSPSHYIHYTPTLRAMKLEANTH